MKLIWSNFTQKKKPRASLNAPSTKKDALQISSSPFQRLAIARPKSPHRPPGARDAGRRRRRRGRGRVGRRAAPLPPPRLPPGGGRRGGAGAAAAGEGLGGRGALAGQSARDVLRGGLRGRAHGAPHLGAHRRAVGPARHRLRDHAPHEASGKGGRPSVSACSPGPLCPRARAPRAAAARVLFSLLY
jgi:hypothetical protein